MAQIHLHPRIAEMYDTHVNFTASFIGATSHDNISLLLSSTEDSVFLNLTEEMLLSIKTCVDDYFIAKGAEVPLSPTISDLIKAEAEDNPPAGLLI
ncbi:hypothetical protein UFOVP965_107 [uncultured Caudovirales phage]|uniref:Uncharacterized protein n=1 Tax=uncultured Caudovirales phage TaxID=2100421 RepID=A0A6J5QFL1_9CAUD|nr:hypothetical protein UFOVP965_107 [uncultured Caudovirales phage]CAB4179895.1 hypothetical protein UFOVP1035_103 [uncultured Caudovirales phage]CAB4188714.1 hypothetical protein UFOVP1181_62 [uncultured Caudovirales phage]